MTQGPGLAQQELESRLWAAANSLRGPVDPSDFKAYIFPLLFFKRISDVWDEEHERAAANFGDTLDDEIEADYHRFIVPGGCHWRDLRNVHEWFDRQRASFDVEQVFVELVTLLYGGPAADKLTRRQKEGQKLKHFDRPGAG